jgi:hypothetical protein
MQRKMLNLYVIIACLATVSGCIGPESTPIKNSVFLTGQPTPRASSLPSPTPVTTPTQGQSEPTQTAAVVTPTAISTPNANEREEHLRNLITRGNGCDLPCWWGIVPGKSRWNEVLQLVESLEAKVSGDPDDLGTLTPHPTGGFDLETIGVFNRIVFYEKKGEVLAIRAHSEGQNNPDAFRDIWSSYSPEMIVEKYGTPSEVWLYSEPEPRGSQTTVPYNIALQYSKLGFVIVYFGLVDYQPIYRICPTFEDKGNLIAQLNITMEVPGAPVFSTDEGLSDLVPLSKANISLEDFAAMLMRQQDGGEKCFEIPRDK